MSGKKVFYVNTNLKAPYSSKVDILLSKKSLI